MSWRVRGGGDGVVGCAAGAGVGGLQPRPAAETAEGLQGSSDLLTQFVDGDAKGLAERVLVGDVDHPDLAAGGELGGALEGDSSAGDDGHGLAIEVAPEEGPELKCGAVDQPGPVPLTGRSESLQRSNKTRHGDESSV